MITFSRFQLANGLRVIHHHDNTTPLAVINILYNVGARDEVPHKTGFAHLFEHLMFGGSVNIPEYDSPLQMAGGENNAFTSNDITNYYLTLPAENIETGFWLESDRMLSLNFSQKSLDVQKGVVIEEFKQRYLNQPYGDVWLKLRPLAYKEHPYQWATIGKDISHIEQASLDDVKDFFFRFYNPNNAILCVAGNVSPETVNALCEKWFSGIPAGTRNINQYKKESKQSETRRLIASGAVPQDALYMAFHMCNRLHPDYYATDLISDILSKSESSRFYTNLIQNRQLFSQIDAYMTGDIDEGLFIVQGRLNKGVSFETGEQAVMEELKKLEDLSEAELSKVKNKSMTAQLFARTNILNKAMGLCYAENLNNIDLVNQEMALYESVSLSSIKRIATEIFIPENMSVIQYKSAL